MRCEAVSERGVGCRAPASNHKAHFDGEVFWPNADYRPPPSKVKPGRKKADRVSAQGRDLMQTARARTTADPVTIREPEPRTWTESAWVAHAEEVLAGLLATRDEPFTTPEHLWPLLPDPLPDVDRRALVTVVRRAVRSKAMAEVGSRRLRDTYRTADGAEFAINKLVPIYQAVR